MTPPAIRPATIADVTFLWDMLFESAFVSDEERAAWRRGPEPPPELARYLDGWGRTGDAGVVAEDEVGRPIGAAWYRVFTASDRGNGILSHPGVPELAIAVEAAFRGRNVGHDLMVALARSAKDDGYRRLMLSVDPDNAPAIRLYERVGFTHIDSVDPARGTSLIMRLEL